MRDLDIKVQWVKPFTRTTIDPDFNVKLQNILDEQFNPERPNAAWCSDITYIPTNRGFVYLTSVMDLFSRKIIAWTLSETLEAEHVANTVRKAMQQRSVTSPLVMHSDRGSQYVSAVYLEAAAGLTLSYSKKGYPYDNACIESFHSLLKREWLNRFKIHDYDHARKLVFEYIDAFYNTVRIHSHCDYYSPIAIRLRIAIVTLKICTIIPFVPTLILSANTIFPVWVCFVYAFYCHRSKEIKK